ncbi:MAG TPA: hypothetical protein VF720_08590 [Candidatus Eisenbacteria bacterium]
MITSHRSTPSWRRLRPAMALGLAGLAALGFAAAGCGDDDAGAGLTGADASLTSELNLDIPALAELNSRLNLSEEQARDMEKVLAAWRSDASERMEKRAGKHEAGARKESKLHAEGARGHGFLMGRMGAGRGFGDGLLADGPGFDHLADAAAILDNDQLATFTTYIEERRQARRGEWRERADKAPHRDGPMARKMASRFGLSESETEELRAAHKESAERTRQLHGDYAAGTISAEQLRDGLRDSRLAMEAKARELMGAEEFEALHSKGNGKRTEMFERRSERLDERATKQAERLARALRMDAAGKSRIEAALRETIPARRQLLDELSSDQVTPEDALYRGIQIEKEASAAIRATLSPDEVVRFDSLARLIPGSRMVHGRG